jgi:starch-binding outer membrane protein, SusD/RagB family
MKKIKYLLIISLAFLYANCEDAVDIVQDGRLSEDKAFVSVDDLKTGLLGVYIDYDLTPEIAMGTYTDEVAVGWAGGGQGLNSSLAFNLDSSSDAALALWSQGYRELFSTNVLIRAALKITPKPAEQTAYNDVLGQLYALRAFSHFQLLSYYSTNYADDNALGIPIIDYVPATDSKPLRNTNKEVYAAINADLTRAEGLLAATNLPTFVTKDFVIALRARMAAYRQDYTTAATLAQQLLAKYPIANRTQYTNMYLDTDNTEIIFKLDRADADRYDRQGNTGSVFAGGGPGYIYAFTNPTLTGGVYFEFSRNLFNLFSPSDIRYTVSVAPTSVVSPNYQTAVDFVLEDRLVIAKYKGITGALLCNDLKVFRSSEMLLILAESYANSDNFNGATNSTAALIKRLRDARFGSAQVLPTYASKAEAFAAILNERRVEFAFEGHRYKDLKRLGVRANQGVTRDARDCAFNGACSLAADSYKFTLPIPLAELNGNPGLRAQQNPGY